MKKTITTCICDQCGKEIDEQSQFRMRCTESIKGTNNEEHDFCSLECLLKGIAKISDGDLVVLRVWINRFQ